MVNNLHRESDKLKDSTLYHQPLLVRLNTTKTLTKDMGYNIYTHICKRWRYLQILNAKNKMKRKSVKRSLKSSTVKRGRGIKLQNIWQLTEK